MNTHHKLRQDAARYKDLQPPANLREQLKNALAAAARPVGLRRWFKPAIAVLAASMVLIFAGTLQLGTFPLQDNCYRTELEQGGGDALLDQSPESALDEVQGQERTGTATNALQSEQALRSGWKKAGAAVYGLLSLATGALLAVGLWGKRILFPLLAGLAVIAAGGLLVLLA